MPEPIDISEIPTDELYADLEASNDDIETCRVALMMGIEFYGNHKSTAERLRINQEIKAKIEAELERRKL